MKLILAATAFLLAVSATPVDEWNQYKAEHNKVYTSQQEDDRRLEQYLKNKEMVEEHNRKYERGETSFTMGINHFSDWFPEEIDKMFGLKLDESTPRGGEEFELPPGTPVPDSIDWREKGAVTSVKDQRFCGSCYAFGAVGALEGLMFITNGTITDLSVQQIVDCSTETYGCYGGWPTRCFTYVASSGGIDTEKSYPYVGKEQSCRANNGSFGATCTGYKNINNEKDLTAAVGTVGPVTICFQVDFYFVQYKSGVYDRNTCGKLPNHAMLAVGYGTDNNTNQEYWLIKNCWSEKWGDKGYARVLRNVNLCGVASNASFPIYSK